MIRPTRRAIVIFACGLPVALIFTAADATLWPIGFIFGIAVILGILADAMRGFPAAALAPAGSQPRIVLSTSHRDNRDSRYRRGDLGLPKPAKAG